VVADADGSRLENVVMGAVVENLSLEELAERCFVSVSTFKRHFRKRYSMPPHQWFIIRKLDLAYRMILATDVPITEIARLCGFTNSSHFIAAFKRRYDTTPASLRRDHRSGGKPNTSTK
jgi:AraC-like DNA-binding protein